ncbi:quinone oxidoreductase family protein [Williamsia sp. SKLECPSW1]
MYAAVVTEFDRPPRYLEHPEPVPTSDDQVVVDVVATALYPRVRSQAAGSHYTSSGVLPRVPGHDAVVRDETGALHLALFEGTTLGSMAQRTLVDRRALTPLPSDTAAASVAASFNATMSSWIALRHRAAVAAGSRVLVLGATGNAGRAALAVARHLGAQEVIAAGRDADRLADLVAVGADRVLTLDRLAEAAEVDVVLDYVWGEPTARGMADLVTARPDRSVRLTWIQIGSTAGTTAPIRSAALRSSRLEIVGSGVGSVPVGEIRRAVPDIAAFIREGSVPITPVEVPLTEVTDAWDRPVGPGERIVFVP